MKKDYSPGKPSNSECDASFEMNVQEIELRERCFWEEAPSYTKEPKRVESNFHEEESE